MLKNINYKKVALILWIVLSVAYILFDQATKLLNNVYIQWRANAVYEIITQVTKECKPINIYVWDKKVDIVNVECLKEATNTWTTKK